MEIKYHGFTNHKTKWIFYLLLPLILLTAITYYFRLYIVWPPVDIPLHILGGASVATIFYLVYNKPTKPTMFMTFGVLMLWEAFEMVGWRLFPKLINCAYVFCQQDVFFWDGFWDLILGMAAAIIITIFIVKTDEGKLS